MDIHEIIGLLAAILTTGAFVPQVYKTYKLKSVNDISLTMYLVLFIGLVCWLIYGIHLNSFPMILANSITGILALIVIFFKLTYKK
jgi:MtN3 and saliva related transmembrane protein